MLAQIDELKFVAIIKFDLFFVVYAPLSLEKESIFITTRDYEIFWESHIVFHYGSSTLRIKDNNIFINSSVMQCEGVGVNKLFECEDKEIYHIINTLCQEHDMDGIIVCDKCGKLSDVYRDIRGCSCISIDF